MESDGNIDYRQYTLQELSEALSLIDRNQYPLNLSNLEREIASRPEPPRAIPPQTLPKTPSGRPKLVWLITLFYFLSAMLTAFGYYAVFGRKSSLPLPVQQQIDALTALDHAQALVAVALNLMAAVSLFRLRRMAAYLFTATLALSIVGWLLRAALGGWAATVAAYGGAPIWFGYATSTAICLYSWHLASQGRLR
jgi:hypothetical protein